MIAEPVESALPARPAFVDPLLDGAEGVRPDTQAYQCCFFDSEGGTSRQDLVLGDGGMTWEGGGTRCDATFEDGGRVLVAHHKMMGEHGTWVPSTDVTLRRVD